MYKTSRNNEMKDIINNEDIRYIMTKYQEFRKKARFGELGPTATF